MRTSVIIPTYNSEAVIGRALVALYSGDKTPDEVIIADGCSHDRTVELASAFPVRVFPNPKVHAAAARNVGIAQATGDVIAFTDSDCVPQPDWLALIARRFSVRPELVGLGGRMLALPPSNDIEEFSGHVFLNEIMRYPTAPSEMTRRTLAGAFITANCAYRRSVLEEVGGFRDEFGNNAEDIDLYWRLVGRAPLYYDPEVIVYHSFPNTRAKLARKYYQYGLASSKLNYFHFRKSQIDWSLYRKLGASIWQTVVSNGSRRQASLQVTQLSSHIAGKLYGSIALGVLNL